MGVFFAVATFVALIVMIWVKPDHSVSTRKHVIEAFIIAVTIIVVAIPEVRELNELAERAELDTVDFYSAIPCIKIPFAMLMLYISIRLTMFL